MRRYIKIYETKESYQTEIDNKTLEFPNICLIDNEEQREIMYNPPIAPQIRYTTTDGEKTQFIQDSWFTSNEWDEDLQCFVMYMSPTFIENTYSRFGFSSVGTLKTIEFIEFENITTLNDGFLNGCSNLEYANFNGFKTINSIPAGFCANCSKLKTIDISKLDNIIDIGSAFCSACSSLKTIIFPKLFKKLTYISSAFCAGCTELESIDLTVFSNYNNTYIPEAFLNRCSSLTSIDLSIFKNVQYINGSFLMGCTNLTTIDFTDFNNVTSINGNFLADCAGLTSLDLTPMTKLMSLSAGFLENTNITSLKITFIPGTAAAFKVISQLTELYVINENVCFETKFANIFNEYKVLDDLKIYVHASQYDKYITPCPAEYKKHFFAYSTSEVRPQMRYTIIASANSNSVLSAVKSEFGEDNVINDYFDTKTSEYVVEISDNVSTLPALKIDEIKTAKFLNFYNIDTIDNEFFNSCDNLLKIDLSGIKNIKTIRNWFLKDCTNLENIILPNLQQVESISSMFMKNAAINKDIDTIDLSSMTNVKTLDAEFLNNVKFKNIILPQQSKIEIVPYGFLINCVNIKTLDLSLLSNCTSIGNAFLSGATSLESIDLTPLSNVQNIGSGFLASTGLRVLDLQPLEKYNGGGVTGALSDSNITKIIVYNYNVHMFGIIANQINSITELYIMNSDETCNLSIGNITNIQTLNIYVSINQYSSYLETYPDIAERLFIYGDLCPKILYTTSDNQIIADDKTGLQDCMISHEYNNEKKKFIITLNTETTAFPEKTLYNCSTIKTISFEDCQKITVINDNFLYWNRLDQINFDSLENVRYIGDNFLYMYTLGIFKLTSCDMSKMKNITYIGNNFLHVSATTNIIKYPDFSKLKEIKNGFGSSAQTSIDIDTAINVETIGDGFLKAVETLTTVNLSSMRNVKTVGDEFLGNCYSLTYADLSNMVKLENVGEKFMRCCADTTKLYKVPDIHDSNSFYNYSIIKELYIYAPELQTNLKTSIFRNNVNTNLVIYVPESLVSEYEEYYMDTDIAGKFAAIS